MISIVIPAYNASQTLQACLVGLQAQALPGDCYEIILVDDGSQDDTLAIASKAGVQTLAASHSGPAAARNIGAQAAQGDIIAFIDSDCVPASDWLAELTAPLRRADAVGVKGVYRTRQLELVARFVQQEYQEKYDRMAQRETIDFIDTYSAAYRRDVFLENGGFEPAFATASVEDQEFSFRLAQKGYVLKFVPTAVVEHQHDNTVQEYLRRKFWIGYWKAYLLRWHPDKVLSDSHTPPTQRLQLLLLAMAGGAALLGPWLPALWLVSAAALVGFFGSAVPLFFKIARRDRPVLWVAPGMLLARAGALGLGLCAGAIGLTGRRSPRRALVSWPVELAKRTLDVLLAGLGLILTLPLVAILSALIKLETRGPVIFRQTRIGQHGRPFQIYKLRSMVVDAEERLPDVLPQSALAGPAFKIPNDPRVTRLGRFMRRWSLDELPQLWNVLRGDMSLVGPRPEEPRVVALYSDWHRLRLAVKPGLTGPMQVNGRGNLSLDERVQLDLDYIDHYSLGSDVSILLRSVPAVLSGDGAY